MMPKLHLCITMVLIELGNAVVTIKMGILLSGDGWQSGNDSYPAAGIAIQELEDQSQTWDEGMSHITLQCVGTRLLAN